DLADHQLRTMPIFFFQAEDGIRDFHVTGVQTCALPISGLPIGPIGAAGDQAINAAMNPAEGAWLFFVTVNLETGETKFTNTNARSEERRVGKQSRRAAARYRQIDRTGTAHMTHDPCHAG